MLNRDLAFNEMKNANDEQSKVQQHYRILLAKAPNALELQPDLLFDSGQVESNDSIGIRCGGNPLQRVQTHYRKVRVRDEKNQVQSCSASVVARDFSEDIPDCP